MRRRGLSFGSGPGRAHGRSHAPRPGASRARRHRTPAAHALRHVRHEQDVGASRVESGARRGLSQYQDRPQPECLAALHVTTLSLKGGDPAAGSPTATLLRLHPSHWPYRGRLAPFGYRACFGWSQLPWCDGRCVQGPGTYSPRRADPRLLAIPPSRTRVAGCDPN